MRRIAAAAVLVVLAGLVAAQLLLPGIAENRLRDRLARDGHVDSVHVSAFPAVKLLWGHADRVTVHMASVRTGTGRLSPLPARTRDARRGDAPARELGVLSLRPRDPKPRQAD